MPTHVKGAAETLEFRAVHTPNLDAARYMLELGGEPLIHGCQLFAVRAARALEEDDPGLVRGLLKPGRRLKRIHLRGRRNRQATGYEQRRCHEGV